MIYEGFFYKDRKDGVAKITYKKITLHGVWKQNRIKFWRCEEFINKMKLSSQAA